VAYYILFEDGRIENVINVHALYGALNDAGDCQVTVPYPLTAGLLVRGRIRRALRMAEKLSNDAATFTFQEYKGFLDSDFACSFKGKAVAVSWALESLVGRLNDIANGR
jgi:hypothetical protein